MRYPEVGRDHLVERVADVGGSGTTGLGQQDHALELRHQDPGQPVRVDAGAQRALLGGGPAHQPEPPLPLGEHRRHMHPQLVVGRGEFGRQIPERTPHDPPEPHLEPRLNVADRIGHRMQSRGGVHHRRTSGHRGPGVSAVSAAPPAAVATTPSAAGVRRSPHGPGPARARAGDGRVSGRDLVQVVQRAVAWWSMTALARSDLAGRSDRNCPCVRRPPRTARLPRPTGSCGQEQPGGASHQPVTRVTRPCTLRRSPIVDRSVKYCGGRSRSQCGMSGMWWRIMPG